MAPDDPDDLDDDLDDELSADEMALLAALTAEPLEIPKSAMPMRNAIADALRSLVAAEHVDIEDDKLGDVADEATLAAMEAKNPRHALKKLRISVIESDNVEEVFCDDLTLEDAFRNALGG